MYQKLFQVKIVLDLIVNGVLVCCFKYFDMVNGHLEFFEYFWLDTLMELQFVLL